MKSSPRSTGFRPFLRRRASPISKRSADRLRRRRQDVQVHLDGYNQLPFLTGQQEKSERKEFFYINDDAQLVAMRYENWKVVFCEQKARGTVDIWGEPFVCLRVPKLFNLRLDPYERADVTSNTYWDWEIRRVYLLVPAQAFVAQFVETFKGFPPRQKPS